MNDQENKRRAVRKKPEGRKPTGADEGRAVRRPRRAVSDSGNPSAGEERSSRVSAGTAGRPVDRGASTAAGRAAERTASTAAGRPADRGASTAAGRATDRGTSASSGKATNRAASSARRTSGRRRKVKKGGRVPVGTMLILLVSVCVFVFSAYQLAMSLIPYYQGGKVYDEVKKLAIENDSKNGFQIDFKKLQSQNPDTVAWIRFDEPKVINYPVVKSLDNQEYLTKTFVASENKLGAIFMDMGSSADFSDRNTFIYGHNLKMGGEMFSQLTDYEKEDFVKKHPYFYIYTPDGKQRTYQIFSAAVVRDTADNYEKNFNTDDDYAGYLQLCQSSSLYHVDTEVPLNPSAKIVSLSTCTNVRDEDRFLVQGVLVEEVGGAQQ